MSALPKMETPQDAALRLLRGAIRDGFVLQTLHEYRDLDGTPLYWRARAKNAAGDKLIRPIRFLGDRYVMSEPPAPKNGKPLYGLHLLEPASESKSAWIVEGESCADALAELGLIAVTSGSASSAEAADWSVLAGRSCIVWPDNDGPGMAYAATVAKKLTHLGCAVKVIGADQLGLPEHGDCVDWLSENPGAGPDAFLALPTVLAETASIETARPFVSYGSKQNGTFVEFRALPSELPDVPAFDLSLLPANMRAWVEDAADGLQVPPDFCAIPAVCALAGTIGRQVGIALKVHERWIERCVLWAAIIGRPSSGKSPAMRPAQRMLTRLEVAKRKQWEEDCRAAALDMQVLAAERSQAKKDAVKAIKAGDRAGARAALELDAEPEMPSEPRLVVNDATVEKLGELLNGNPRGLVQFRDELAGWLAGLDREGREADRGFWLECWNGQGPYTCDRIGRGTVRIEAPAVSILGGVQPGKLAEYVRGAVKGGFGDDGLMQRFQLAVYPDVPASWRYVDRMPSLSAERSALQTFQRLDSLSITGIGAEQSEFVDVPFLRLAPDAQEIFVEWQTSLMLRLRAGDEPPFMESHLAKYPALAGRLALVLHLADNERGPIGAEALATALDWIPYLEGHARRIYAPATDNGIGAAYLLNAKRKELGSRFTARDVYRKGWAGLDRDSTEAAIDVLLEYGHLDEHMAETGGRPLAQFVWRNPV